MIILSLITHHEDLNLSRHTSMLSMRFWSVAIGNAFVSKYAKLSLDSALQELMIVEEFDEMPLVW